MWVVGFIGRERHRRGGGVHNEIDEDDVTFIVHRVTPSMA